MIARSTRRFLPVLVLAFVVALLCGPGQAGAAPSGTMSLNGGATSTTSCVVTVNSSVTGTAPLEMRFFTSRYFTWTSWRAYSAVATALVAPDYASITAEYRDASGTVSLSDSINYVAGGTLADALDCPELPWRNGTVSGGGNPDPWRYQDGMSDDGVDAAINYASPNTIASLETTVEGPGTMTFRWFAGVGGWDQIYMYDDSSIVGSYMGPIGWTDGGFTVATGVHTLSFQTIKYSLDGCFGNHYWMVDNIVWNPDPPTASGFLLNGGSAYTSQTVVTASAITSRALEMDYDGGLGYTGWRTFAASSAVTVSAGDGLKTVCGSFRNKNGSCSATATITLHSVAPTGSMIVEHGAEYTTQTVVSVDSTVTDSLAIQMRFNGGSGFGSWTPYSSEATVAITGTTGTKTITAEYRDAAGTVTSLSDAIEFGTPVGEALNAALPWTTTVTGGARWYYQTATTHDGVHAARSGAINNSGSTSISTTVTGPGTLTFWYSVSSEAGFDYLRWFCGGVLKSQAAGFIGWTQATIDIPAGPQVVRWEYMKDEMIPHGSDCAWIDEVVFVPTNRPPLAVADAWTVDEDTTLTVGALGVLANDTDADSDTLSVSSWTAPSHGTLVGQTDGSFAYRADPDWNGIDTFSYRASDGATLSAPATVTITVDAVNDDPVAVADAWTVDEDTTLTVGALGVLANDTDADSDTLSVSSWTAPSHGTLVGQTDGSFAYRADPDWNGIDTFSYRASDGKGGLSGYVDVTITVDAVNDAPVAAPRTYDATGDTTLSVAAPGLLTDASDPDGTTPALGGLTVPANGSVVALPDGSFTYRPVNGFVGADSFTYRVTDGSLPSAWATVTVNVTAPLLTATSITIKTTATSVRTGNIPILSGAVTPLRMVGKNIVAYVKKPGKAYFSYSSNRTVYNLGGKAVWQYKYYFKPGMVKGVYVFKAVAPAPGFASSAGFATSTSPMTVSIRLR